MNNIDKYAFNFSKVKFKSSEMIYNKQAETSISYSDNKINENNFDKKIYLKSMRCQCSDWDLCEINQIEELNETRQRASQMENTMRWWSQCTANWREKWSTVRNERNRARDELTRLRTSLYEAKKEIEKLITAKEQSDAEVKTLKLKLQKMQLQNTLQPILQDISIVKRIANALTSKLQQNFNLQNNINNGCLKLESINIDKKTLNNKEENNNQQKQHNICVVNNPEKCVSAPLQSVSSDLSTRSLKSRQNNFSTNGETRTQIITYQYGGKAKPKSNTFAEQSKFNKSMQRRNSFC